MKVPAKLSTYRHKLKTLLFIRPMIRHNRSWFDYKLFALIVILGLFGLVCIYSATTTPDQQFSFFFKKQVIGFACGLCIYLLCSLLNFQTIIRLGYIAYLAIIALLFFTLIKGSIGMGAQRWLNLWFFKIQPSECAKLLFPLFVSYHLHTYKDAPFLSVSDILPVVGVLALSCFLIIRQPDLGTALVILFSGCILLWFIGIPKKVFLYVAFIGFAAAPALWYMLRPYQRNRISVFLGYGSKHKERYQTEQALIAIGSGGLWGKGFLQGTQNKLHYLPESRTDFIFAVLCEEWGFVGALCLLTVYALLLAHCYTRLATTACVDMQLSGLGVILHIMLCVAINIAMVVNLLPITGIPLPFMSYGLTNLWVVCASLGCLSAITRASTLTSRFK